LPSGEYGVIATFTPAENGEYNFVMDEKLANCYDGLYDSGNNPVAFDTYATLTGGETYTISFYNGSSSDVTGELTATHGHKFDFSSNTCSVCNKQIIFDAEEDKAVSVSIDPWNTAMVRFTPAKSGDFIADYDSKADVYFNGVLDTSGTPVSPVYDDYNGEYAVLTQGEAYYFVFKNYEDSAETVEATISHRHVGAETVVAEPTVACDGLTRLDCATCGESLFAITGYTGIYKSDGTTEDGFEYKIYEKDGVREAAISGYTGTETEITIPAEVEGVPVTAVRGSYYGFLAKNSTVTSVTIPEGIREIGDNAFTAYTALEEVTIPDSVIIIGDGAFYGCVNLKGVTLGKNVAYVGEDAFTTVMDEKDKERSEYYYASVEEYIAPERDMADIEREYFDNMAEDYFGDYSDFSGKPVSSWADVLSVVQEADLDAYNSYFNTGYTDKANLINDLEGEIGFFEGNIGNIDRWKNEIENITQSISDVRNDEGEPIAWVIYNGSEENFAKIGIENNNDELTEARRGVDGKDPAFIITYDANGGEKAPEPQTGFKDVTLTAGEPEYYGYTFLGWAKTNNAAAAEYAAGAAYRLEEDVTFYAVWGAKAATLTYDANGGTNAPAAQNGYGKITLSTSAPSKEGYNFLGWAKTNNATAAEYAPGAEFTLEENTTLYAIWQKIYTLTYDANGGTNAPAAQQGNGEITLSAAKPTRDGYEFLGWAKTNNATAAEYEAGAKLNLTEDTTVYAVWKATFKLPEFSAKSASYNTYVTVSVKLNNVPAGAEVWIDGKKAEVDESGTTYSVEIGQVKATKEVKIEVKQGGATLDEATLTIKVDSNFFSKLISFFSNFLFNLFKWKQVTVKF
ncbi:MAG: InlB B-repeat-containing protein, partial [Clostridia bacterium]|nr:InlB B-repeat-containing protein [Clostridia bacterium]